jgi:hypothetical protein
MITVPLPAIMTMLADIARISELLCQENKSFLDDLPSTSYDGHMLGILLIWISVLLDII